ncbi:DNA recombination protein RmuC [Marinobacter zhanjiangensis]|uniref:DNA recombination protein RmuC n=1 Tax=Marinobacter zhanjiangensis TaxID=578215 RepID=A0ABQ3AYR7_9GAMM|nr:DNA recombination protein RmuC [Marinobacter zhanjiangensis]
MNPLWEQIIEQPVVLTTGVVLGVLAVLLLVRGRILANQLAAEQSHRQQLEQDLSRHQHDNELQRQRLEQITHRADELDKRARELDERSEHWRGQSASLQQRVATLEAEKQAEQARAEGLSRERDRLVGRRDELSHELESVRMVLRERDVTLDKERKTTTEKLELLERNRDALKQEFENLANRIFEQKSERFTQQTRTSLDTLLNPFRDQLQDFRKRVEDVYTTETRDRQALRSEIKSLQDLNRQITEEAANLTRALKGDKKIQGNWGELILERVLEKSGLRKGMEYDTQGSYRDADGQLLRPDVVVHLPDKRNLIIDSKVSLVAYQQWVTEEDDVERENHLKAHVEAVRQHIRSLSEKDYSQLNGLHSPDFVLLFMPIEPAFVAAFQYDENLFAEAFEKKIIVVTPTTLLATLRTIENIWRYERQSQNARKIADRASAVYDKLRIFVETMEKMGGQLQTVQTTYDGAMNTLTRGRGNLISQASKFVELGVRVKKELPRTITDQADAGGEDDDVAVELNPEEEDSSNQAATDEESKDGLKE